MLKVKVLLKSITSVVNLYCRGFTRLSRLNDIATWKLAKSFIAYNEILC